MPEYEFYMIGQSVREKEKNESIISEYYDIPNLHFTGHLEGKKSLNILKKQSLSSIRLFMKLFPLHFLRH